MTYWQPIPDIKSIRIDSIEGREDWFEFEFDPPIAPTPGSVYLVNNSMTFHVYEVESYDVEGNTYIVRGEMLFHGEQPT